MIDRIRIRSIIRLFLLRMKNDEMDEDFGEDDFRDDELRDDPLRDAFFT